MIVERTCQGALDRPRVSVVDARTRPTSEDADFRVRALSGAVNLPFDSLGQTGDAGPQGPCDAKSMFAEAGVKPDTEVAACAASAYSQPGLWPAGCRTSRQTL